MFSLSTNTLIDVLFIYIPTFIFVLPVGSASIEYYAVKSWASNEAILQFERELPEILRRIYGIKIENTSPRVADLSLTRSVIIIVIMSSPALFFTAYGVLSAIRSDNLEELLVSAVFAMLEGFTWLYFLTLGRKLATIEKAKESNRPGV